MSEFGEEYVEESQGAERSTEENNENTVDNGIVKFLEEFDYADGVVPFEEEVKNEAGEVEIKTVGRKFDELGEDEKYDVLKTLTESNKSDFDVNEDEKAIISTLREKGVSFDDLVNQEIEKEVDRVKSHYETKSVDYDNMDKDIIMMKSLKEKYKDESDEEIKERFEIEKGLEGYDKKTEILRDAYKDTQQAELLAAKKEVEKENEAIIEKHRKIITNKVVPMDSVAGWPLTDQDKNNVLHDILEVDDKGNSLFYNEIFSDPQKMFEAAYLYKNANTLFNRLEAKYANKLTKAVKEAKESVFKGSQETHRSDFSVNEKQKVTPKDKNKVVNFGEE